MGRRLQAAGDDGVSTLEWRQQSRLLDQRDRLKGLLEDLRFAPTSRSDSEIHGVTADEAAIQANAIEDRLTAVDAALDRIDTGGYGMCLACGAGIADERLEALPRRGPLPEQRGQWRSLLRLVSS